MAIDPALFAKAAKVYEASEPVDGMKPKEVYESHKKCAPGEFGMNKEGGVDNTVPVGRAGATGAGLGALIGAMRAPKGKMLKYTLGGAGIGGLAGLGGAAGYNLSTGTFNDPNLPPDAPALLRLPLAIGGAALGGHLGNKLYDEVEDYIPEKKEKKNDKQPAKDKDEKQSAIDIDSNRVSKLVGGVMGAAKGTGLGMRYGGLAGLLAGGLHGAAMPGEYTDATGKKKKRSRLMGALRGGAGYGALGAGLGGLGGGLGGYYLGVAGAKPPVAVRDGQVVKAILDPETHERIGYETVEQSAPSPEKQSARAFGEKVAEGVNWQNVMNTGLGGAALGAGLGGLTGLVAPGTDENGRRRSRFGAMLRGALGGGLMGGGAGAAAEVASPGFGGSAASMARNYGGDLYRRFFGKPQPIGSVDGQPLDDAALPEGTETNMIEAVNALKNDAQGQYDVTGQRFRNYMRSGQLPFTPGARSQYGVDANPARAQGLV